MKLADTISVNPGKNTLGHVESSNPSVFRSHVLGNQADTQNINILSLVFPTPASGISELRKYDLPLRTIFATILIIAGISSLASGSHAFGLGCAVSSICLGAFLAIGFFTRPVMLGAAVYYCITGALTIRSGATDFSVFALMFGCLIFGLLGAGKYSCDTLLRHFIGRRKNISTRNKNADLGYKAFHKVNY